MSQYGVHSYLEAQIHTRVSPHPSSDVEATILETALLKEASWHKGKQESPWAEKQLKYDMLRQQSMTPAVLWDQHFLQPFHHVLFITTLVTNIH